MAGRDPYLRSWVKVPTGVLDQGAMQSLSAEQYGIFVKALLFSTRSGLDIGFFHDRETGAMRSLDEIGRRIRPDVDQASWADRVNRAFERFHELGLVDHDDTDGWHFTEDVIAQFLNENNLEKVRAGYRRRTTNKRDRDKRRQAEPGAQGGPRPIALRRERS